MSSLTRMRSIEYSSGLGRSAADGDASAVRGILHGAMALYLTRYLNVPPARIPGDGGEPLDNLPNKATPRNS